MSRLTETQQDAYERAVKSVRNEGLRTRHAAEKHNVSYRCLLLRLAQLKTQAKPAATDETAKLRKLLKEAADRFDAQGESYAKRFTEMHDEIESLKAQLGSQAAPTRKSAAKPAPTFLSLGAMQQEVNRLTEEFRACTDTTEQTRIREEIDMLQTQLDAV